jgi:hypothetical protein
MRCSQRDRPALARSSIVVSLLEQDSILCGRRFEIAGSFGQFGAEIGKLGVFLDVPAFDQPAKSHELIRGRSSKADSSFRPRREYAAYDILRPRFRVQRLTGAVHFVGDA